MQRRYEHVKNATLSVSLNVTMYDYLLWYQLKSLSAGISMSQTAHILLTPPRSRTAEHRRTHKYTQRRRVVWWRAGGERIDSLRCPDMSPISCFEDKLQNSVSWESGVVENPSHVSMSQNLCINTDLRKNVLSSPNTCLSALQILQYNKEPCSAVVCFCCLP